MANYYTGNGFSIILTSTTTAKTIPHTLQNAFRTKTQKTMESKSIHKERTKIIEINLTGQGCILGFRSPYIQKFRRIFSVQADLRYSFTGTQPTNLPRSTKLNTTTLCKVIIKVGSRIYTFNLRFTGRFAEPNKTALCKPASKVGSKSTPSSSRLYLINRDVT